MPRQPWLQQTPNPGSAGMGLMWLRQHWRIQTQPTAPLPPPPPASFASWMIKSHLHAVIHPQICPAGAEPGSSDREGPEAASTGPAALAKAGQDGSSAGSG